MAMRSGAGSLAAGRVHRGTTRVRESSPRQSAKGLGGDKGFAPGSGEPNGVRLRKREMRPRAAAAATSKRLDTKGADGERWASVRTVGLDDVELASWFSSGDADAVRVVYQTYGRLVFAIAYRVLGDTGLAQDATQQTFLPAWRAAGSYEPSRALGAWLTTIAKRVAIDVHRREHRHRNLDNIDTSHSASLVT